VRLQASARSLAGGRLDERTPPGVAARSDEIGALAREFDSMAERLSNLIAARHQLLRDLSHELRSPLARLQMAVGLARQEGSGSAAPLDRIERESERLERMIAQILEYSRLERDPSSLQRERVDIVALAEQVVHDAEYESQSPPGRITVINRLADHANLPRLQADPQIVHSALDNVVRNALRYGGRGRIEVVIDAVDGRLTLAVRDYGPGVPEEDLRRIFEPFYRVARPDDGAAAQGSGIGLAVAAKAMELHGGRVIAENVDGGGLQVTLELPLQEN
jgi:two-component system sensor histidine kinase CpxA